MPAYVVVDITNIHDDAMYAQYRSQVSKGLEAAGGRYLVRGGAVEILEGEWKPGRLVIVRFESAEGARHWWASSEYAPLKRLRGASTRTNMVLVSGVPTESEVGR